MALPEGYLPREGDELLIRVKVTRDVSSVEEFVSTKVVGSEHRTLLIDIDKIHALHCRAWSEGDKVSQANWGHGTVVAVHEDMVWVRHSQPGRCARLATFEANALEPYVAPEELAVERMTEAELLAGLEGLMPPPEAPCDGKLGSQSQVGDDDDIAF
jgi:hypothetical protein